MLLHVGHAQADRGDSLAAGAAFSEALALARPRGIVYGVILVLAGIGRIAATAGAWTDAVRLFTAAGAALERISGVMPRYMTQRVDQGSARARAALDQFEFDAAVAGGRGLTLDEAAELARRVAAAGAGEGALTTREPGAQVRRARLRAGTAGHRLERTQAGPSPGADRDRTLRGGRRLDDPVRPRTRTEGRGPLRWPQLVRCIPA